MTILKRNQFLERTLYDLTFWHMDLLTRMSQGLYSGVGKGGGKDEEEVVVLYPSFFYPKKIQGYRDYVLNYDLHVSFFSSC